MHYRVPPEWREFSNPNFSRRAFLAVPVAAAVAACATPYDRRAFALPSESAVGLFPASSYDEDLEGLIYRGLRAVEAVVRGKRVLLKPNLVEYDNGTCINTNPAVIAGAVGALRRAGARSVTVGEGPGHRRDLDYLLAASGLWDVLKELRVDFVDLNTDDVRAVRLASRFTGAREIELPVSVLEADLIVSMPKLKTHHWAGVTCALKNLFGTVPGAVYGWPKNVLHRMGIMESIVDLAATIRPALSIVDAIVAMEGDGPIMGRPRELGFIAVGTDAVAVDATLSRVIGFDPQKIPYLRWAGEFLGRTDEGAIVQRGETPSRYATRFSVVEHLARWLL